MSNIDNVFFCLLSNSGELVSELVNSLEASQCDGESVDLEWVHNIGCGCDDTELPHHISTVLEIQRLKNQVTKLLQQLPSPKLVTVSRYGLIPSMFQTSVVKKSVCLAWHCIQLMAMCWMHYLLVLTLTVERDIPPVTSVSQ